MKDPTCHHGGRKAFQVLQAWRVDRCRSGPSSNVGGCAAGVTGRWGPSRHTSLCPCDLDKSLPWERSGRSLRGRRLSRESRRVCSKGRKVALGSQPSREPNTEYGEETSQLLESPPLPRALGCGDCL